MIYTVISKSKKSTFKTSKYGAQIDPTGLRLVLNDYYRQYRLPLIITENGLGTPDHLTEDGKFMMIIELRICMIILLLVMRLFLTVLSCLAIALGRSWIF